MRRIYVIVFFAAISWWTRGVAGQTTQPSGGPALAKWQQTVAGIADALTSEARNTAPIATVISDGVAIQKFGSRELDSSYRLQQQTIGMTIVSAHAYTWPVPNIASNMANDVRDCECLPGAIQKQFIPRDDADARRANTTAAQWVQGVLQPGTSDLIAVLVLWEPQPLATNPLFGDKQPEELHQPMFVLIKAQRIPDSDDDFRITQISYGDVREALN